MEKYHFFCAKSRYNLNNTNIIRGQGIAMSMDVKKLTKQVLRESKFRALSEEIQALENNFFNLLVAVADEQDFDFKVHKRQCIKGFERAKEYLGVDNSS